MNFGSRFTPVSFFTPPSIPTVTTANNGVSLSGTTVVLGNNVAAVGDPAQLLNSREVQMNGFTITFINPARVRTTTIDVGAITLTRPVPILFLNSNANPAINASLSNVNGSIEIQDSGSVFKLKTAITTGNTEVAGTIKTGSATQVTAQPWKLGQVVTTPGLTFDTDDYVAVQINGVLVRLALANLPA